MTKIKKLMIIVVIIGILVGISEFNIRKTKLQSVNIDAKFLRDNWAGAGPGYDVEEVLHIKKFTDTESLVIALVKNSQGTLYVYEVYDGKGRYDNVYYEEIQSISNYPSKDNISYLKATEFGQPFFCVFVDPKQEKIIVHDKEYEVFRFKYNVDGQIFNLGFYCGMNTN